MCSKINLSAAACVNSEASPFSKLPTFVKMDSKFAAARAGGTARVGFGEVFPLTPVRTSKSDVGTCMRKE